MQELPAAVAALFEALADHGRAQARGDEEERRGAAARVGARVDRIVALAGRTPRFRIDGPPPRAVATAMARALFAAPHLSQTLSVYTTASETLVFHPTEPLADALGLPVWQLEELREEVDQQVSRVLRQSRVLHWLWQRSGNPRVQAGPLFRLLFPGVTQPTAHHFAYRGGRLYAVFEQAHPPPPEALYLRWLPGSERWDCIPDSHFAARWLDPSTVRALSRGVGASEDEIRTVLDEMVCVIPLEHEQAFVAHDRWRAEGWSAMTGLGAAHPSAAWLTLPLAPEAIGPEDWLERTEAGLVLRGPRRVFDRHAMGRLTAMTHGLYAEICARLVGGRAVEPADQPVLFDLDPYVQRILQPLLDWTADPRVHRLLAAQVDSEPHHVGVALAQVRQQWLEAARSSWGGAPVEGRPWTVQAVLAVHLALVQASLYRMWREPPDPRAQHHRILLLFFAQYVAQAPLGRLWRPIDGRLPPPEDVVGEWFWGTWLRCLDAKDVG